MRSGKVMAGRTVCCGHYYDFASPPRIDLDPFLISAPRVPARLDFEASPVWGGHTKLTPVIVAASIHQHPAIHFNCLPEYVAGGGRGEEQDDVANLVRSPGPALRNVGHHFRHEFGRTVAFVIGSCDD